VIDERDVSNLFHGALDTEPYAGAFQRLQLELEASSGAAHRRRARRIVMTPNRVALLAAALIALLLAGVLVGTRVYRDYQNNLQVPSARPGIDQAEVARLLARPFTFKLLSANQPCPKDGPMTNSMFGAGPVYGQGGNIDISTSWGAYATEFVITPPGLVGPVVLRALDLRNGQPQIFLGSEGAGPVYGTDTVNGKSVNQYAALAFDTNHSPKATYNFGSPYVQWSFEAGWPHSQTGFCAGLQVDAPAFTEVFYASVTSG
jgi:hypothetical protein